MKNLLACLLAVGAVSTAGCSLNRAVISPGSDGGDRFDVGIRGDVGPLPDVGPDAPPSCTASSCDDGQPCTADSCDPISGCVFTPTAGSCDDGVLCNGADTCGAGTCSVHDGITPCLGASRCDPALDACTGCVTSADCPAETTGVFGACMFDSTTPCALTGERARTITTYTCGAGGMCEPSDRTETEPCARTTDGDLCGAESAGAWGACSYALPCDESATRMRTITTPVCGGGTCGSTSRTEYDTAGCARSTSGMSCGAMTSDPFGPCTGFAGECGESGTQSRNTYMPTCAGGVCDLMMATESQACTRDTDLAACGTPSCTPWGICFTETQCVGTGVQFRACAPQTCVAGACTGMAMTVSESRACMPSMGSTCFASFGCSPCRTSAGACSPAGATGMRTCTFNLGSCSGTSCGSPGSTMSFTERCTCGT